MFLSCFLKITNILFYVYWILYVWKQFYSQSNLVPLIQTFHALQNVVAYKGTMKWSRQTETQRRHGCVCDCG